MRIEQREPEEQPQAPSSRRGFFKGLLMGVGAAAAVAVGKQQTQAKGSEQGPEKVGTPEPILYHRTDYMDRYFRTFR